MKHIGETPEQQTATLQIAGQLQSQLQLEGDALARAEQQKSYIQSMMTQSAPVVDLDQQEAPKAADEKASNTSKPTGNNSSRMLKKSQTALLVETKARLYVSAYARADPFLRWYGPLANPVFQLAHVVTVPSEFLAEVIRARIGVAVEIVPNIVDLTAFPYRERKALAPRMLVTRHLEKLYRIESVLLAFREVQARYTEASLWIVGSGTQESYLRGLAATGTCGARGFWDMFPMRNCRQSISNATFC